MKNKLLLTMGMIIASLMFASCGGGGGDTAQEGGGGSGVASVDSLSSIPTVDLSEYDSSSSTSASLAARGAKSASVSRSASVSKAFGENMKAAGGASRAGCEQDMQKKEVFRMSQMAQLERCYPEKMEKVGLIAAIPTGSYAHYRIVPPDMGEDQRTGMCNDIPSERTDERAACERESQKSGAQKTMLLRLGKIDNQLHIDMCEGDPAVQANSATYRADGSLYTASVVRIGEFGGETESGVFSMSVDIGTSGSVTDGVVTIGDSGYVSASGQMSGRFGSGNISFDRAADSSVKITGAFTGSFTDPFSDTETSFTGKTYSHVGGSPATGCAKFSFTGSMPAMRAQDMIPPNIGEEDLGSFLQVFGAQLGIELTAANYQTIKLCPNPDFDPNNFDPSIKPMIVMSGASCGSITHTGTECFSVTNAQTTTDFGTEITQVFTITSNDSAAYYAEVNAFDLSAVSPSIGSIAFSRVWDCSGAFTDVDFMSVPMATIEAEMRKCFAIEEKARNNAGMGNEGQCGKGEQMNAVNDMAEGGGGAGAFGGFGGEYSRVAGGTCPQQGFPDKMFANSIDDDTYCIPSDGGCQQFDIVNNASSSLNLLFGSARITKFTYDANPATSVVVIFAGDAGNCSANYSVSRPEFNAPPAEFGGAGGGDRPGETGYIPAPCQAAGLTGPEDGEACYQLCMKPGTDCR